MTAKHVPTLDGSGRIFEKHIPARLGEEQLGATFVRFVDENGDPLESRHVVIKVHSTTGEILDIVSEA